MIRYRKIQMHSCIISYDSFRDIYKGVEWPDEVVFLDQLAKDGWELVSIVDDHKTFIFKGIFI